MMHRVMAEQWGPRHQVPARGQLFRWPKTWGEIVRRVILALAVWGLFSPPTTHPSAFRIATLGAEVLAAGMLLFYPGRWLIRATRSRRPQRGPHPSATADPLKALRDTARKAGGGAHLGLDQNGQVRFARSERAVLLLGPPRSGKTSSVIIPTLLSHTGPVVATSTKPDVLAATGRARARYGRVWVFDPAGTGGTAGGTELRWSPVTASGSWDGALLVARAMTSGIGLGTTDRSHWANRAQALLAPMLHAAAVHGRDMQTVVDWVMSHDLDQAGMLLEDASCSQLAFTSLVGVHHTEARERSSIFSAAADALAAYTGERALEITRIPNFNPTEFVSGHDTVYIHAPGEAQAAAAPIVCGLLAEIRRATYQAHAAGQLAGRVLFALDEVANIAPLEELPQIASEGGGQGLLVLAALQDLSQARSRWGTQADGFLTLFGTKLILPGIADTKTLEAVSTMLGEYDRQVVSQTHTRVPGQWLVQRGETVSTQRSRVLSPGEIANIPAGRALHLDGVSWELVTLTPAHLREPWRSLTAPAGS